MPLENRGLVPLSDGEECSRLSIGIWIGTSTFCNLKKYIEQFEEMHFVISTNTFDNLKKHILQLGEIRFLISPNTFAGCQSEDGLGQPGTSEHMGLIKIQLICIAIQR